jgi:hypothetical protein
MATNEKKVVIVHQHQNGYHRYNGGYRYPYYPRWRWNGWRQRSYFPYYLNGLWVGRLFMTALTAFLIGLLFGARLMIVGL